MSQTVTKQLYLSEPAQSLDRIHPGLVTPIDNTTANSETLGDGPVGPFNVPTDVSLQLGDNSITPDLAVHKANEVETIHMVYLSKATGAAKKNIYYTSKTGTGSWGPSINISSDAFNQDARDYPSIAVDVNNTAHVVYAHQNGSVESRVNIYYVNNADGVWSTPQRISDNAFDQDALTPEIALDNSGNAHVVYVHKNGASDAKKNIYYLTNASGSWSTPVRISSDAFNQDVLNNPAIAVDGADIPHVAYVHQDDATDAKRNIYYVQRNTNSWSAPLRVSSDAFNQDVQVNPSIAIDKDDLPHIVYAHRNSAVEARANIYYVEQTGMAWSSPISLSNDLNDSDSTHPDLAFSAAGIARVAFANEGKNVFYMEKTAPGSTWTAAVDINPSPAKSDNGNSPSIAFSDNAVHVAFQDKHETLSGDIDVWYTTATLQNNLQATTSFVQNPAMCSDLLLPAGEEVTLTLYLNINDGTMPDNPAVTASLSDTSGLPFITLLNPTYQANSNILSWTGTLVDTVLLEAGNAVTLEITTCEPAANFTIAYDSDSKPSHLAVQTANYIEINTLAVYDAPYPAGNIVNNGIAGDTHYIRAAVSDPFGTDDITDLVATITGQTGLPNATVVATDGCTKIYEVPWMAPAANGTFAIRATAEEGYENTVTDVATTNFDVCQQCPPSAIDDFFTIMQGASAFLNPLANDSDPNGDLDPASFTITQQPTNGSLILQGDGAVIYAPNGSFFGTDVFTYQICDLSSPTPLCSEATVTINVEVDFLDVCEEANRNHTYYLPFSETELYTALRHAASCPSNLGDFVRNIISIQILYPGTIIAYDHWEDGYEVDLTNPIQTTTGIWGDGDLSNGVAPGFADDIIPAGGSIVLDQTMNYNPRDPNDIFFDGKDKLFTSTDIALSKVSGDANVFTFQSAKTDVYDTNRFGTTFVVPFGEDLGGEFNYTSLFIRAKADNTTVTVDVNADGVIDENDVIDVLDEGEVLFIEGTPPDPSNPTGIPNINQNNDVHSGATITATQPVGVDVYFGGIDCFGSRNINIYPGAFYSNVYYTPVPTTNSEGPAAMYLYNSLSTEMVIKFSANSFTGTVTIPARTTSKVTIPLLASTAYKLENEAGQSFVAMQVIDSDANGSSWDWAFNLIGEERLTDFTSVAWAPGSLDGSRNDNPIWVTPVANTILYVKFDGDITADGPNISPCGLAYDVAGPIDFLNSYRILDNNDNDQSGTALYTCDGTTFVAVYGEDPSTALTGSPSLDVGTTLQPLCKDRQIIANDDFVVTPPEMPVLIGVLDNDDGFTVLVDAGSVSITGLLQPTDGAIAVNADGTINYTPNAGFLGTDMFEYQVCSQEFPGLCDVALVTILVSDCNANINNALINGYVYLEQSPDNGAYDDEVTLARQLVNLYTDANCNGVIDGTDAVVQTKRTSAAGAYTFKVTTLGCYLVQVDASDGNYELATLNTQTTEIQALSTCVNELYLGLLPILIATDDQSAAGVDIPQVIPILDNDQGQTDLTTLNTMGVQQPANGTVVINGNGTITYIPDPGYTGTDVFEYQVCSLEDPLLCDVAQVSIMVSCLFEAGKNIVSGSIFGDADRSGIFEVGESLLPNVTVNLYEDTNSNGTLDEDESSTPIQTATATDGNYSFVLDPPIGPPTAFSRAVTTSTNDAWEEDDLSINLNNSKLELNDSRLYVGTRFQNVTIPQGAEILSATITFVASDDRSNPIDLQISTQAADNPTTFTSADGELSTRWDPTNLVRWLNVEAWIKDATHTTPSITALVQSLVDRPGWSSGNSMVFLVNYLTGDERKAYAYDDDPANAPVLNITYQVNNYPLTYFTTVDPTSFPANASLTSDSVETVTFTNVDQAVCSNNFGLNINIPPVATDNRSLANPPGPVTLEIILTDDGDGPDRDSDGSLVSSSIDLNPSLAGQQTALVITGEGTWMVDGSGQVTFTPEAGFTHDPTDITYTIADDGGKVSNVASIMVDYIPVATDDESLDNPANSSVVVDVLSNDLSGDLVDPTTVVIVGAPNPGDELVVPNEGTWQVDPTTGAITFTPEAAFTADPTPITYTVNDDEDNVSAPAQVTINYVAQPPVAMDDSSLNNPIGTAVSLSVTSNDTDPNANLDIGTVDLDPATAGIQNTLVVMNEGTWTVNSAGSVTFTPDMGFNIDPTSILYTVSDLTGLVSNTANIIVTYQNAFPLPVADSVSVEVGMTISIPVTLNDNFAGNGPSTTAITITVPPNNGTATVDDNGTPNDPTDDLITYVPAADYIGPDVLTYQICDANGDCAVANVEIQVISLVVAIALEKTGVLTDENDDGVPQAGETIAYEFAVTNIGDAPLTDVVVIDPPLTVMGGPIAELAAGVTDQTTFTATYTLTQSDIDSGQFVNAALVQANSPADTLVTDFSDDPADLTDLDLNGDLNPDDSTVVELTQFPNVNLTMTGMLDPGVDGTINVGDSIYYTLTVTNTGNVTIGNITLANTNADAGSLSCMSPVPFSLAPNGSITCTAIHTLTQQDLENKSVTNVATVSGQSPAGSVIGDTSDDLDDPTNVDADADGDPDDPTIIDLPCLTISAWVYLEGAAIDSDGGLTYQLPMRTDLNDLRLLPGQAFESFFSGTVYAPPGQPYDQVPWNYSGTEGDAYDSGGNPEMGDANYPVDVVDWVLVSLRSDPEGNGGPLCQTAALLHSDGRISFVAPFSCCEIGLDQPYYVVVEHRNHLLIMSDQPIPIVNKGITYDFRNRRGYIDDPFGFGISVDQKELANGIFAMYAGNGSQAAVNTSDTDVNFDDRTFWEIINGNFATYQNGDYNLNGDTNFNDRRLWEINNGNFTSVPRE